MAVFIPEPIVVDGKTWYDYTDLPNLGLGLHSECKQKPPGWKYEFHSRGIINFGKEYGKFNSNPIDKSKLMSKAHLIFEDPLTDLEETLNDRTK